MVNEPKILVNNDFFTEELDKLYKVLKDRACEHRDRLFMACCESDGSRGSYIEFGYYTRCVTDARITGYSSGIPEIEVTETDDFEIKRLKHKSCGHTHGLMFELFIPYQKYTVRFVLILLYRYFLLKPTIEEFCGMYNITARTFEKWLKWLEESMPILTEAGIVRDRKENRQKLMEWIRRIWEDHGSWQLKSLTGQNLALFQRHRMPAHYLNYDIKKYRKIQKQHTWF
ncbi:MAG: hypothetical protein IKI23_07135 [Lachnospiraceae bacterium]|nr:hypothetical protein [Lachnospiraceae bacterium]